MTRTDKPSILVGVNGSVASAGALRWAADEAKRRHARLQVVCSWEPEFRAPYASAAGAVAPDRQCAVAAASLAALMRAAFGTVRPAGVTAELTRGTAERVLTDRSADADLLVLGSAAPPAPAGRSVGPVVRACLRRSECPVVVVSAAGPGTRRLPRNCDDAPRRTGHGRSVAGREVFIPQPRDLR